MSLHDYAREAVSPAAWYWAAGIAIIGFTIAVALAGPLAKL